VQVYASGAQRIGYCSKGENMILEPQLRKFVTDAQVNYQMGPDSQVGICPFLLIWGVSHHDNLLKKVGKLLPLPESVYKWKFCIREVLKYSRRIHIFNTTTTLDVSTRRVWFWKGLRKLEVEAIVVWTNVWLQRRCFGYTRETH